MQTFIGEPVIPRNHQEDEKLILEFLRIMATSSQLIGLKLEMHAAYWASQAISEFVITTRKSTSDTIDVNFMKQEGRLWEPERDPITMLQQSELDTIHNVIWMLQSWEYESGFRTSNPEIFKLIGSKVLVVKFWPTILGDVDVDITFS